MESRPDAQQPTGRMASSLANREGEEMVRLDREARQLLRDSLPLLDAGRREEAAELVTRAVELMQGVADRMERSRQKIMAQIAAHRSRPGATNPAEPAAAPDPAAGSASGVHGTPTRPGR